MATLDRSPNPADISMHISVIHLFFYHPPSIFITTSPLIIMPINLSNLLLKTSPALPLPWRLPERLVRRENIGRQRIGKDGRRRSVPVRNQQRGERQKNGRKRGYRKQREHLARDKVVWEAAAAEEQWQSLATGLSGLKLTIPALASITCTALGSLSLTQSKGKRKATEEAPSVSQYVLLLYFILFITDFFCRSRFPSCNSCTITSIPCLMEMWKNGTWRTLCDQCQQRKMACHWDLVCITGPWDPNTLKQARRMVKKPVINVDDLKDTGDGTAPSPVMDLAASVFAVQNTTNVLVTESASIRGIFVWFNEQIATNLDRMMEVLVREQVVAQRDQFVSFRLLEQIMEALERSLPRQARVVPMEGLAAEEMEVVPVVIADVEWAWTPLFLRDLDPMDMHFALEASKDSDEDLESSSGSEESGSDDGSFGDMDGDAIVE
jgi:hypothetical protein